MKTIKNRKNRFNNGEKTQRKLWSWYKLGLLSSCFIRWNKKKKIRTRRRIQLQFHTITCTICQMERYNTNEKLQESSYLNVFVSKLLIVIPKKRFLRRQRISVLKEHQNIASLKQIHIFSEAVCSQNIVLSISVSGQRSENHFPLSKNCGF